MGMRFHQPRRLKKLERWWGTKKIVMAFLPSSPKCFMYWTWLELIYFSFSFLFSLSPIVVSINSTNLNSHSLPRNADMMVGKILKRYRWWRGEIKNFSSFTLTQHSLTVRVSFSTWHADLQNTNSLPPPWLIYSQFAG